MFWQRNYCWRFASVHQQKNYTYVRRKKKKKEGEKQLVNKKAVLLGQWLEEIELLWLNDKHQKK